MKLETENTIISVICGLVFAVLIIDFICVSIQLLRKTYSNSGALFLDSKFYKENKNSESFKKR